MENEQMRAVLTELLENQKEITRSQREIMAAFQELKIQMEGIKNQAHNVNLVDIKPIQQVVEKGIADTKFLVEMTRQKSASNNLRVFLESDAKKWAVYLVGSVI